jgi:hypothetical protein
MELSMRIRCQCLDQQDIYVPFIVKWFGWVVRCHKIHHLLWCTLYRCRPGKKCTPRLEDFLQIIRPS